MTDQPGEARHYLILRAPDEMTRAAGVYEGFVLVAVHPTDERFESPLGAIAADDAQRFMYAGDVARAVQRGSATTKQPGVVVGQRMSSLAAYPHLRLRHVLQGTPPETTTGRGPSELAGANGLVDEESAPAEEAPGRSDGAAARISLEDEPDEGHSPRSDSEGARGATIGPAFPGDLVAGRAEADDPPAQPPIFAGDTPTVPDWADAESPLRPSKRADEQPAFVQRSDEEPVAASLLVGATEMTAPEQPTAEPTGISKGERKVSPGFGLVDVPGDDDAFAAVLAALEDGAAPDLGELMDLPRSGRGWQAVVTASGTLKLDSQLRLAQDLVLQLLGEDETRAIGQRWLLELADKLRHRADLLVRLISETWQYADPQAALQELRNAIRRGSVRISQRSGTAVAPLLRDLARTADDSEALADAYLAMADAPERRNVFALLLELVQEVEAEDSGGNGERLALGLEILKRAYRCANGGDFAYLAPHAERYMRTALRQEPVNEEAAEAVRPMLAAALSHVDESAKKGIQDALRELQLTLSGDDNIEIPAAPSEIVKLADALNWLKSASVNVQVLPSAYESAARWGKKTAKYLPQFMGAMKAIAEVSDAYAAGAIGPDGLYGAFTERGQDFVRKEADQTRQRYAKQYLVKDAQGRSVQLQSHLRLGADFRIYLTAEKSTRRVLIGHVGEHLKVRRG